MCDDLVTEKTDFKSIQKNKSGVSNLKLRVKYSLSSHSNEVSNIPGHWLFWGHLLKVVFGINQKHFYCNKALIQKQWTSEMPKICWIIKIMPD